MNREVISYLGLSISNSTIQITYQPTSVQSLLPDRSRHGGIGWTIGQGSSPTRPNTCGAWVGQADVGAVFAGSRQEVNQIPQAVVWCIGGKSLDLLKHTVDI